MTAKPHINHVKKIPDDEPAIASPDLREWESSLRVRLRVASQLRRMNGFRTAGANQ